MAQMSGAVNWLPAIPVLLAHLAGVVVAIILLVRQKKSIPAVLALIGFGLLLVLGVANFARGPLIRLLSHRGAVGVRFALVGVGCCYSILEVVAIACLIIAIGLASRASQASSSAGAEGAG